MIHPKRRKSISRYIGKLTIVLMSIGFCFGCDQKRKAIVYLIPDGYKGEITLHYHIKDAPKPVKENNKYVFTFDSKGKCNTSIDLEEGSALDEYYYVKNGKRTPLSLDDQPLGSRMVWGGTISGISRKNDISSDFIGTHDEYLKFNGQ